MKEFESSILEKNIITGHTGLKSWLSLWLAS